MNAMGAIALFFLAACGACAQNVTINALNSTPEKFDGRRITVSGWMVIGPERRYIVATKHNYTMWRSGATCLSIINGDDLDDRADTYNSKHVLLTGVFRSDVTRDRVVRLGLCGHTAIDLESKSIDGRIELTK